MRKSYDIYITYSEQVKSSDSNLSDYIDQFVSSLKLALIRISKTDISIAAKSIDFGANNYTNHLITSKLILAFVHPKFMSDNDYVDELVGIGEICEKNDTIKSLFKICIEPAENITGITYIENVLSYNLFEKNRYNRKVRRLDFDNHDTSVSLFGRILDLAYDIDGKLNPVTGNSQEHKYVLLGLTTDDQISASDLIRRELLQIGYTILPSSTMPDSAESFQNTLIEYLNKSELVIQIMGSQYGEILKGSKYSVTDFQNRVIRKFQTENPQQPFRRLIWIPQNLKIGDQRQAMNLKRIRRDDAIGNTEIIESPLATFKNTITTTNKLFQTEQVIETGNISRVYLLTEESSINQLNSLYNTFTQSGLKVVIPDYSEQLGIYTRHLNALRDSDAVVLLQTSQNINWLNSKLRDIVKSPGIGRAKPYAKVILISNVLPNAQLIHMLKENFEIIEDVDVLPEVVLSKLITK